MKIRITGTVIGVDGDGQQVAAPQGIHDVPDNEARRLLAIGSHVAVPVEEEASTEESSAPAGGAPVDYDSWTKEELEAEVAQRGLTVTRADGREGEPLKSDLVAALAAAALTAAPPDDTPPA